MWPVGTADVVKHYGIRYICVRYSNMKLTYRTVLTKTYTKTYKSFKVFTHNCTRGLWPRPSHCGRSCQCLTATAWAPHVVLHHQFRCAALLMRRGSTARKSRATRRALRSLPAPTQSSGISMGLKSTILPATRLAVKCGIFSHGLRRALLRERPYPDTRSIRRRVHQGDRSVQTELSLVTLLIKM